jgi:hypothetical protein
MYLPPGCTELLNKCGELRPNALNVTSRDAEILAYFHRTVWAIQIEHRFHSRADYMHMRWPVIIRINDDTKAAEAQYGRHPNPKRLGFQTFRMRNQVRPMELWRCARG